MSHKIDVDVTDIQVALQRAVELANAFALKLHHREAGQEGERVYICEAVPFQIGPAYTYVVRDRGVAEFAMNRMKVMYPNCSYHFRVADLDYLPDSLIPAIDPE